MIRKSVPGALDLDALAALSGRDRHRPTDPAAIAQEIRRLHRRGHSASYIAATLHVTAETIARALTEQPPK